MDRKTRWVAGGALALAVIGGGAGLAIARGGDDTPLTGRALERARTAALQYIGGGSVIETEVGDGTAAYEVGIRLDDGSQVEVSLDDRFRVISQHAEDEGRSDRDAPGDK